MIRITRKVILKDLVILLEENENVFLKRRKITNLIKQFSKDLPRDISIKQFEIIKYCRNEIGITFSVKAIFSLVDRGYDIHDRNNILKSYLTKLLDSSSFYTPNVESVVKVF